MTRNQFNVCVSEALNYSDVASYISDLSASALWGDREAADIPAERVEALDQIFRAVKRNAKDIAVAAGMSARSLAAAYNIPRRTMENWTAGVTEPPLYVLLMLQELLGLLPRIDQ